MRPSGNTFDNGVLPVRAGVILWVNAFRPGLQLSDAPLRAG